MKLQEEDAGNSASIPWHVLDARKTIDQLHEEIQVIAKATLERATQTQIPRLWL